MLGGEKFPFRCVGCKQGVYTIYRLKFRETDRMLCMHCYSYFAPKEKKKFAYTTEQKIQLQQYAYVEAIKQNERRKNGNRQSDS